MVQIFIIYSIANQIQITMIQGAPLPPLVQFQSNLKEFNLRNLFKYLLYFVKSQQKVYGTLSGTRSPRVITEEEWEQIPQTSDRYQIIKHLTQILSLNRNKGLSSKVKQLQIISAQKFIIGMIITGHVHIYEIIIKDIMPLFVKIITNQIEIPSKEKGLMKKIRQFCKQTIFILSVWFPNSFYDPIKSSWFKKAMSKYRITCQFILYYTNQKIDEFEKIIKSMKISEDKQECFECVNCLLGAGKNFQFSPTSPEIPSIIRQQEQPGSSYLADYSQMKLEDQRRYQNQLYLESPRTDEFNDQTQNLSISSNNSKISDRIQRYRLSREQKKKNSRLFLSKDKIMSKLNGSSFGDSEYGSRSLDKSKISCIYERKGADRSMRVLPSNNQAARSRIKDKIMQRRVERESNSSQMSNSALSGLIKMNKTQGARSLTRKKMDSVENSESPTFLRENNGSQYDFHTPNKGNKMRQKISEIRSKNKSMSKLSFTQKLAKKKSHLNNQSVVQSNNKIMIWHNAYNDNNQDKVIESIKKSSQSTQNTIPQKMTKAYAFQSIFVSSPYKTKLQKEQKKKLKKQCLKINKKKVSNKDKTARFEIKMKVSKTTNLQVKISSVKEYSSIQGNPKLVSPTEPEFLLKQKESEYLFNFSTGFKPIQNSFANEDILLPITIISMLDPIKQQKQLISQRHHKSAEFIIDQTLFKDLKEIYSSLHLKKVQKEQSQKKQEYTRSYYYFGHMILISGYFEERKQSMQTSERLGQQYNDQMQKKSLYCSMKVSYDEQELSERVKMLLGQIKYCIQKPKVIKKVGKNQGVKIP